MRGKGGTSYSILNTDVEAMTGRELVNSILRQQLILGPLLEYLQTVTM